MVTRLGRLLHIPAPDLIRPENLTSNYGLSTLFPTLFGLPNPTDSRPSRARIYIICVTSLARVRHARQAEFEAPESLMPTGKRRMTFLAIHLGDLQSLIQGFRSEVEGSSSVISTDVTRSSVTSAEVEQLFSVTSTEVEQFLHEFEDEVYEDLDHHYADLRRETLATVKGIRRDILEVKSIPLFNLQQTDLRAASETISNEVQRLKRTIEK
ncbi:hypothetical protein B0H13DRAFT_726724 [Mycena leptocephala]|nr:hypothetical protein B0H13DRAFT_726724 [Mycena leptocephala]